MSIGEQFSGLDMKNLIGGPLTAAADASILLAQSTADFITQVGFDKESKTRTVQFKFTKQEPDPDGNVSNNEMGVDVPLLAIVPIPNLQIDEVNVLFDMEVKQSERSESALDMGATLEGSLSIGPVKVSIKGSVSSHSSNTRSSDNSAKYHVDVRATNHGIPEGLARVLDMMAANVAPNLISSKATDANGKELAGKSRERNLKLKSLREKSLALGNAETAAKNNYDLKLKALKDQAAAQRATALNACLKDRNANMVAEDYTGTDKDDKQKAYDAATQKMDASETYWDNFNVVYQGDVERVAATTETPLLSALYPADAAAGRPDVSALDNAFSAAVTACRDWKSCTAALDANRLEYNQTMMNTDA